METKREILIILILLAAVNIVPIAIFGADIAMSIFLFDPDDVDVEAKMVFLMYGFSEDFSGLSYTVEIAITTPTVGFIPKVLTLNLQAYDEYDNPVGSPKIGEFPIGETGMEKLLGHIAFTEDNAPGSLVLTIKGSGEVTCLGFYVFDYDLPPQKVRILY